MFTAATICCTTLICLFPLFLEALFIIFDIANYLWCFQTFSILNKIWSNSHSFGPGLAGF